MVTEKPRKSSGKYLKLSVGEYVLVTPEELKKKKTKECGQKQAKKLDDCGSCVGNCDDGGCGCGDSGCGVDYGASGDCGCFSIDIQVYSPRYNCFGYLPSRILKNISEVESITV